MVTPKRQYKNPSRNNLIASLRLTFSIFTHNMNLVIGAAFVLALALNRVHGGVIGNQEDSNGQNAEEQPGSDEGHNIERRGNYGEAGGYEGNELSNHIGGGEDYGSQLGQEALGGIQQGYEHIQQGGGDGNLGGHIPEWQGGFTASHGIGGGVEQGHTGLGGGVEDHAALSGGGDAGIGGGEEHSLPLTAGGHELSQGFGGHGLELGGGGHGLELGGGGAQLGGHGIDLGGYGGHQFEGQGLDFGGDEEPALDLKPRVEVQHDHIPTKTIEQTKPVPVTVVKKIGVPVPHPVGVPTPQVIKVPVPQPYAVHVPVPEPIAVPIYKLVPQEIEKKVPINVEKLVPVYVDKPYKVEIEKHHLQYVDKPYPVHVPVYKHIFHQVSKYGGGGHGGGH